MQREFDLSYVDREKLLECLWRKSKPAAFFTMNGIPPPPYDKQEAKSRARNGYVDYACGRCIKTQIFEATVIHPSFSCIPEEKFVGCIAYASPHTYDEERIDQ